MTKILVRAFTAILLAASFSAQAQQPKKMPRLGFVDATGSAGAASFSFRAIQQGLHDFGWMEGQNIIVETRYAEGRLDLMPALVNELVQQQVDVIVATNNVIIRASRQATKTI